MVHALICSLFLVAADDAFSAWVPEPVEARTLPATHGEKLPAAERSAIVAATPTPPYADWSAAIRTPRGQLWAAAPRGVMYLAPGTERWRLFHSRHWLPGDVVRDIALDDRGDLLVQTDSGIGRLARREMSLERKMVRIDDTLQKYHVLRGFVGSVSLKDPSDLSAGHVQRSNDNDGLWTSMYVAAEAFRYAVTGDETARQNARRSLEALMFLERITGISGFCARSVVPIDEPRQTMHGEWHRSADGKWWWKGDTSSDEVVGHYFAYWIYYAAAATEAERREIKPYVERITDHILDHGLNYVGPPGIPTTWGEWSPTALNHTLRRIGDRGLNSLEILSHLKVAETIVGKPRYAQKIKELVEDHAYATNTVQQKQVWPPEFVNHSDDELAFLAYYPLVILEQDERLRTLYLASIRRSWLIDRPEVSPLFNFIYGAALQASIWRKPLARPAEALIDPAQYDRDASLEWLRDVSPDTRTWRVVNSDRNDIGRIHTDRFRRASSEDVLPVSERRVMKWNGNPYGLDGGGEGSERDDGTFIILPYWMGRYHRFID